MDQIKTGKFIAQMRKEQGLTQIQLADKLFISNKTVSKWETGKGMPDPSLMLPLCEALGINVNELLAGERIPTGNYKEKAEEIMINLVKEAQESKKKIILSALAALLALLAAVPLIIVTQVFEISLPAKIILIVISVIEMFIGISIACVLDREAGAFECSKCKTHFVPSMIDYINGAHTITKRKLKCPNCGSTGYCKHVLTKNR